MELIEHTVAWCRGEIFEGRMLALFGAVVVGVALVFWRVGSTPSARAIVVPLLFVGALALIVGVSMSFNNQARIGRYRAAYADDPAAFVESERARTEAFIKWYPYTMYAFSAVIVIGCSVFLWKPTPLGRAIGLAAILLGFAVLVLDHFSEERADGYHAEIMRASVAASSPP